MSWLESPVVGFDTETTGVDVGEDRIVTAAVVRREGRSTSVTTWLVDPGVEIPSDATAVHGITTGHARRHGRPPAPALEEIAGELADALAHGEPVVAFNASFDLSLLDAELRRHGLPTLRERLGRDVRVVLDPLVLDRHLDRTREGARRLGMLCGHYDVRPVGALHAADVDVLATLGVLEALARAFPTIGAMTLDDLHELQVDAHRAWAEGYNARPPEPGRERRPADLTWPLRRSRPLVA